MATASRRADREASTTARASAAGLAEAANGAGASSREASAWAGAARAAAFRPQTSRKAERITWPRTPARPGFSCSAGVHWMPSGPRLTSGG